MYEYRRKYDRKEKVQAKEKTKKFLEKLN